jgi:hypothetical protein
VELCELCVNEELCGAATSNGQPKFTFPFLILLSWITKNPSLLQLNGLTDAIFVYQILKIMINQLYENFEFF